MRITSLKLHAGVCTPDKREEMAGDISSSAFLYLLSSYKALSSIEIRAGIDHRPFLFG